MNEEGLKLIWLWLQITRADPHGAKTVLFPMMKPEAKTSWERCCPSQETRGPDCTASAGARVCAPVLRGTPHAFTPDAFISR